jgi:hypothetical protein
VKKVAMVALVFASLCGNAGANILNGSVSFDSLTNLYTYSYVLDDSNSSTPIAELSVLIDSAGFPRDPVSHTTPPGWNFDLAFSGSIAGPPYNESGSFWQWGGGPVAVGDTLDGFSFTTPVEPTTSDKNNYFLFYSDVHEFGHIVAPDFSPNYVPPLSPVPEPGSGAMLALGALTLVGLKRRTGRC